ncbi:MAG: YpdA family putative bacillithiol disulfide reductase [Longimicrobiales bacterium]|nr:YpdA family putative bacillithiol disulfide reductase [Longimicrobiales bacterium]
MTDDKLDLAVIGAGPCGLSAAVAATEAGLTAAVFDKGCITRSITLYPTYATFFSTADRLEIGGVPFIAPGDKPTRGDALKYYRRVAADFDLDVRQYQEVLDVDGEQGAFVLRTRTMGGENRTADARNVVIATGYAGSPNYIGVPGEDLPKVHHYFTEGHPYFQQDVVVIGAGNSAVEAALATWRAGARVTLVHFLDELDPGVKPWIRPDIESRLEKGEIDARWSTRVTEILPDRVRLRHEVTGETEELANDFVLAMTGYRPDPGLLLGLGVTVDEETGVPAHDPETMETDVPGVFIAGVVAGGNRPDRVFIEDGRHHGPLAVRRVLAERGLDAGDTISLGVPPSVRPPDPEADGIRGTTPQPAGRGEQSITQQ